MSKKSRSEGTVEVAQRVAKDTATKEIRATLHRGPLPSPDQMEKYEKLWPGATEFFFEQFKKHPSVPPTPYSANLPVFTSP